MNRYNATVGAITVGVLSIFTFVYAYHRTKKEVEPIKTESSLIITATHSRKPDIVQKKEKKREAAVEKQRVNVREQHEQLLAENSFLIKELDALGLKETPFISTLQEQVFKNTKEEIAFVKKEMGMLKKANGNLKKEIKKLQRKK